MRFRPCIDIHDGRVKQIVGGSLKDSEEGSAGVKENFVSDRDAVYYAGLYKDKELAGGHVIMLNHRGSENYEATREQAFKALKAYPGGLMAGGGINPENALEYINAGASHVIVTSYVFKDGRVNMDALRRMREAVGRDRLCLDLSCRKRKEEKTQDDDPIVSEGGPESSYYIVTDRWQRFTKVKLGAEVMDLFSEYASEFLVHAVDSEGKQQGIDGDILAVLKNSKVPITYAGGVGSLEDIREIKSLGEGRIDFTVGSALDIFGGSLALEEILECIS